MKRRIMMFAALAAIAVPSTAQALSLNLPPPEEKRDKKTHVVSPQDGYLPYDAVLMVGPEYAPMDVVPYSLLIDGREYFIEADNPNVLPLIWGLREGAYSLTAVAYLADEYGSFPDPDMKRPVAHVVQFVFE